jgi:hypothetical protein
MRPVEFGEALVPGTRLTLLSDDKPERLFTLSSSGSTQHRVSRWRSRLAFLPTKSKTACRAVGLAEAGGRQDPFAA